MGIRILFLAGAVLAGGLLLAPVTAADEAPSKFMVYIGTYTRGTKSEGIYRFLFDPATGKVGEPSLAGKAVNPSFLALHPNGKLLYSVDEVADFAKDKKKSAGAISAFRIDDKGGLELLNQESSEGSGPCHIVVDKAGKNVLAANYGGGSVCVLPILEGGKVGKATGFSQHKGKSINKGRQEAPHAHSVNLDAANRFAFVADLGIDKVMIYRFDPEKGTIQPNDPPSVNTPEGGGPRHFAFHPSGKFAYVCNELTSSVTAMTYDSETGKLEAIQTISTLPEEVKGNSTAEVVVHPTGKFVYVSNRGHNSIAQFTVDEKTGKLTANGHQGEGIKVPRNFCLDPSGRWCLVASQDGDNVRVFKVDATTGKLEATSEVVKVPRPICVRFLSWK
jgi:6-phosphogluconolactonase